MKHKKLHITFIFFLLWSFFYAQNYSNYTVKDNLPSNHVYTILQDIDGFIWFLTDKGMVKYNGFEFKQFTTKEGLPNNDVWNAFITSDNKVWYLSKAAQLGYISNDTVQSFPSEISNEIINPIFSSQVKDDVYPTGPTTSYQLVDKQWKKNLNSHNKMKVFHSKIDYLQLNKSLNSLSVFGKNASSKATFDATDFILNNKRGQITDSLFFFINEKNYHILNLKTLKLHRKYFKNQLHKENVQYGRINLVHNKLQISGKGFVAYLDEEFNIVDPFFFPKEINAHFGLIDISNTVWCATFNNGVYKIPYNKRDAKYSFLGEKVQSLDIVEDKLIASVYDKGFYEYDFKKRKFIQKLETKGYIYGTQSIKGNPNIYYLSNGNIYSKNGKDIKLLYDYASSNSINNDKIRKLLFHEGQLFGMFAFGVNKLNSKTFSIEKAYEQKGMNDILSFNNQLLIATTNGLKSLKKDTIVSIPYNNELLNKSILSLKKISETQFLINTDGFGAYIANNNTLQILNETKYLSVQDAFIQENAIWLATNKGVWHYEKIGKDFVLKTTINTNEGTPINNVNTVVVIKDKLFVATDNGLVSIPKKVKKETLFLDVFIDKIRYNSKTLSEGTEVMYTVDNNVNILVATIDFSEENKIQTFNYKLAPIQKNWNSSTTSNISFNNLQPNDYQLIISQNGIEKSFHFTIKPLWWQTIIFRALAGIGIAITLLSAVWILGRRIQRRKDQKLIQEKELSEIKLRALRSQMNPHFVFNSLSAIQYYINENDFEASELYLVKFSRLIRRFFELSKENEITLKEEIKLLENYLEIEKLRFKEKLTYQIIIHEELPINSTKIPTMLLQPIVENAVNHGIFNKEENGMITLQFIYIDTSTFRVEIIDNGVGYKGTKNLTRKKENSSNVLQDRLRILNQSRKWSITHENEEVFPDHKDKGNKAIFIIKKIINE
ncbi:histidine kinase [Kordia sp.]|uniref:sensor histidine kinase n=1 Tax=Kordia sp. TaxID=1965332 RepID=UPI003B59B358